MYPIIFENIYFDKIWGGREFELFRDNLPEGNIGESWDIACHQNSIGIVKNGQFKGMSFDKLIETLGESLIGEKIPKEKFPLLVKLINAKEALSVQVHPNDEYGMRVEGEPGKTEVWYVVEAFEGANLIVGTKNCTKEQFLKAIETGIFDEYLNKIFVKKGEMYFVKSGLVHSIGEGVIIAEIQQNSDTTYRVYDYNRGREIHINKSLDCIDFSLSGKRCIGLKAEFEGYSKTYVSLCDYFSLEKYEVFEKASEASDKERFFIFTCVDGAGVINYSAGSVVVNKGDSLLIPATLGTYEFVGQMTLLKSYVPDMKKVEQDIIDIIKR